MKLKTVKDVLEAFSKFPLDMPVRIAANGECRDNEYYSVSSVNESHITNQNTDGDPDEYYHKDDKILEGDAHFKYQGKLILIS